jgi:hypothetical protein
MTALSADTLLKVLVHKCYAPALLLYPECILTVFLHGFLYRYLKAVGQQETLPGFVSRMEGVLLDESVIKAAIQQDKAKEAQQRAAASQRGKA